jgi:hypothetical protein
MKKTKNITKYDIRWQIIRASLKGKGASFLKENIEIVKKYFLENKSQDRWERSVNWLEGVIKGYGASNNIEAIDICLSAINDFGERDNLSYENFEVYNQKSLIKQYSFDERYLLWKDLFKYNKHYCSRRYRALELESLIDQMYEVFIENNEHNQIKENFSYDKLLKFRSEYKNGTNNKKFFF